MQVFEWVYQTAQGELVDCEVRLSLVPSGTQRLVRASVTNISDRKRRRAARRPPNARCWTGSPPVPRCRRSWKR
jgi:hypothetical protein